MKKVKNRKEEIIKIVIDFVKKYKKNPSYTELIPGGVRKDTIIYYFKGITGLKDECRKLHPKVYKNIVDETIFDKKKFKKAIKKYKRFIVTSAVTGCPIHARFVKSIMQFCKKKNAHLLVIPITDPASNAGWDLDPILIKLQEMGKLSLVMGDISLNDNIYISKISMSSKQIDPTTGLDRLASDASFIYGSPKQRLKFIPNSKGNFPHALMGTGCITLPNYETSHYMSKRTAYLAQHDHKIGGIIVEVPDKKHYHFRQIQSEPSAGNFSDLGNYYKPNSAREKLDAELVKLGDWHAGDTCPAAIKSWKELCKKVSPKYVIMEDLFDGKCINHHDKKKLLCQAKKANAGKRSLEKELKLVAKDLTELVGWAKKQVVVTYSNHDDFLYRWLESGDWIKDAENFGVANKLAESVINGEMPLKVGVEKYLTEKVKKKVRWLEPDESWKVGGIEQGVHGHNGPDGAKGSLMNIEKAYRRVNMGHRHTPAILRDAWQVGTSTFLDLDYTKGASSWLHSSLVQYPNGMRQLVNSIAGKWRFREKDIAEKKKARKRRKK